MNCSEEIIKFLEEEQQAILSADFSAMEELLEKKQAIVDGLARSGHQIPEKEIKRIRDTSLRNDSLLQASQKGLLAAGSLIRDAVSRHKTYGRDGERAHLTPSQTIEKKL